jgi:hypothetical protein
MAAASQHVRLSEVCCSTQGFIVDSGFRSNGSKWCLSWYVLPSLLSFISSFFLSVIHFYLLFLLCFLFILWSFPPSFLSRLIYYLFVFCRFSFLHSLRFLCILRFPTFSLGFSSFLFLSIFTLMAIHICLRLSNADSSLVRDFSLPPRYKWDSRSSGMLRSADW